MEVISVDNLHNSSLKVLDGIEAISGKKPLFEAYDVRNVDQMNSLFEESSSTLDGVIHFAAYKAVSESVEKPLKYYDNNIGGLIQILRTCYCKSDSFYF